MLEKPTREDVKQVLEKTQEDVAAVPCELGGGLHGHIGTTIGNDECASVMAETFEAYTTPRPLPTIATDATQ